MTFCQAALAHLNRFVIEWKNHEISRRPLSEPLSKNGRPLFDVLVEIIEDHGKKGAGQLPA